MTYFENIEDTLMYFETFGLQNYSITCIVMSVYDLENINVLRKI